MAKEKGVSVVIPVSKTIFVAAKTVALGEATTLPALLAKFIEELSKKKVKSDEAFIHESDAEKQIWCASRATLYSMRKSNELRENDHYIVREGSLIFYKRKVLRDFFKKNYPHIEQTNLKTYIKIEERVGGELENCFKIEDVGGQSFRVYETDSVIAHLKSRFPLVSELNIRLVLDELSQNGVASVGA